ncbi:MAG: CHAT domain-containing protein, partial [Planctomycetales bacterium]|nr:CHAT domain-containing protein [Planctomycetales bacterium]
LRWSPLPGADGEASAIAEVLKESQFGPVQVWKGDAAIEETFKAVDAPRILHVATHGFFLAHQSGADALPIAANPENQSAASRMARLRTLDNALLRSGIVLAGANRLSSPSEDRRIDDGWVTAEEIAACDFSGVELAVLSACESGLGDVRAGQGVQGLQRAFQYAGAEAMVMSLFKVPDIETRDLMERFYAQLVAGQSPRAALAASQRDFIRVRRELEGGAHPFFWASFVFLGETE